MILIEHLDKVLEWFYASMCKQDETDLSPMRLKGNQMVFVWNCQNSDNFQKLSQFWQNAREIIS